MAKLREKNWVLLEPILKCRHRFGSVEITIYDFLFTSLDEEHL